MFEVENRVRQNDLNELAQDDIFEGLHNSTVLVTGATGLIGSEIVLGFLAANRIKNLNIRVVALVRNYKKAQEIFKNVLTRKELEIVVQDINDEISYEMDVDYIIHCASNTSSENMLKNPVDTILTNINGTKNALDFGVKKIVKSFVYLSSIEAYGVLNKDGTIKEEELGYLDLSSPRSSYPESKRMCENLCISYAKQFGINVKIARLTQTFGAGVNSDDKRVFAQFVRSIINNQDIILHTKGLSSKSYCYLTDACSAILCILLKGKSEEFYNIANPSTKKSIKAIAEMLAEKYDISVKYEISDNNKYFSDVDFDFDVKKLFSLGFYCKVDLEEMFSRLVESFRSYL